MRYLTALLIFLTMAACKQDETISGYTDADEKWTLVELDGKPFNARATIAFPSKGKVSGHGPCNSYGSSQTLPLPWFKLGPIMSTKMACPNLKTEQIFFEALGTVSLAETLGNTLILSNENGLEMVFKSDI